MSKLYRHYKNKDYKYWGEAIHSETLEKLVVYETRYSNPLGKLWVRPKKMFFETVEKDGQTLPRFNQISFSVVPSDTWSTELATSVEPLLLEIFAMQNSSKVSERLKGKEKLLLLQIFDGKRCVGFKLGYELGSKTFYSWLGGVDPSYRGLGLGRLMMDRQHLSIIKRPKPRPR